MKILFYPEPPIQLPGHSLSKTIRYFQLCNHKLTNDIKDNWDIAVYWNYKDINNTSDILLKDNRLVLNKNVNNVTKSYVDKIFTRAFGYSSLVNTDGFGYCVRKSDRQSAHDGEIIQLPCIKESGFIYQLLLDNRIAINMICDIRIPVFLGKIPLIFLKSRGIDGTFGSEMTNKKVYEVATTLDCLTSEEIKKIGKFCQLTGLDIGELDAIRDNSTGKLYIIDLNNIPGSGLFHYLKNGDLIEKLLSEFMDEILFTK